MVLPLDTIYQALNITSSVQSLPLAEKKFFDFASMIELDRLLNDDQKTLIGIRNIYEIQKQLNKKFFVQLSTVKFEFI